MPGLWPAGTDWYPASGLLPAGTELSQVATELYPASGLLPAGTESSPAGFEYSSCPAVRRRVVRAQWPEAALQTHGSSYELPPNGERCGSTPARLVGRGTRF